MPVCYRHPSRETGVSCSSCGRPICPDCMTPTSVGMRCPACSRERTKVRKPRATVGGGISASAPVATYTLIVVNALAFVAETSGGGTLTGGNGSTGTIFFKGALDGPAIAIHHQFWRLVTSGFLHGGFGHIFFNMLFLYFIGPSLEAVIGRLKFFVVYFVSLIAGAFGALLFQPLAFTVGASGACFGVLGALMVVMHDRRVSIWNSGLGIVLVINIAFSLAIPGISIGGHLGGFIGGAITGWLFVELDEHRRMPAAAFAASVLVAALSVAGAIAVASGTGLTPNGGL